MELLFSFIDFQSTVPCCSTSYPQQLPSSAGTRLSPNFFSSPAKTGLFSQKCGLTADALIWAELVTADGSVVRCSETEEPDLFWAIRGAGSNFGVITQMEFRLHPIDKVFGGMAFFHGPKEVTRYLLSYQVSAPPLCPLSVIIVLSHQLPADS